MTNSGMPAGMIGPLDEGQPRDDFRRLRARQSWRHQDDLAIRLDANKAEVAASISPPPR